jgi:CBS-domain-containing membrane protein
MLARRVNCLPVLYDENEQVCGIVTPTDLLSVFEKLQASVEKTHKISLAVEKAYLGRVEFYLLRLDILQKPIGRNFVA